MTTKPTIDEMREYLDHRIKFHGDQDQETEMLDAIRSALLTHAEVEKERDALKAEVERLKDACAECIAVRPERLEQLSGEVAEWRDKANAIARENCEYQKQVRDLKAVLAAARPLLEAVEQGYAWGVMEGAWILENEKNILRAALAYRAAQEAKGKEKA